MKPVAYVGADPGLTGAVALYVLPRLAAMQPYVEVLDMPTRTLGEKRSVDFWRLDTILKAWASGYDIRAAIVERVSSSPQMGVTSAFTFGFSSGALQQAVASAGLPMTLISPATWKAMLELRGGRENKADSRAKATALFPAFANLWARAKDDGRAEAVLLAYYGSKLP